MGFVPPCGVNFTALTGAPMGAAFACERVWIRMLVQMLVAQVIVRDRVSFPRSGRCGPWASA
jgi:hypothetical protein